MLGLANMGNFQSNEISEEMVSSLENDLKKFLDNSLLEKSSQEQQKEIIQSLFDTVCNVYRQKALAKNVGLHFQETDLQADFNMKWTAEALGNIVDNALKYTHPGGSVTVSSQAYTFFARIDVTDAGIGIAQEEHAKIIDCKKLCPFTKIPFLL